MKRLIIFFAFHFFIVFTLSVYLTANAFFKTKYHKEVKVPVINFLVKDIYDKHATGYLWISGLNTGYGFYGINVSTQKFFIVNVYDKNKNLIIKDNRFNFHTTTGYMRFDGFAYHIANFISESDKMRTDKHPEKIKYLSVREDYVNKVFKYLGKAVAKKINDADTYTVKLCTIIPHDIWSKQKIDKNQVYVEKEIEFNL